MVFLDWRFSGFGWFSDFHWIWEVSKDLERFI